MDRVFGTILSSFFLKLKVKTRLISDSDIS